MKTLLKGFSSELKKQNFLYELGTLDKSSYRKVHEKRQYDRCDARSWARGGIKLNAKKVKALEAVWPYLEEQGHTGLELSLGYNLSHEEMSSVICGMRNPQQLHMTIKALQNLPDSEVLSEVKNLVSKWND